MPIKYMMRLYYHPAKFASQLKQKAKTHFGTINFVGGPKHQRCVKWG
jgi:hypothetical protein